MPIIPSNEVRVREFISTGIPALDKVLGGGIGFCAITEISGKWSSGKSTLAFQTLSQAQKLGAKCLLYDVERSYDPAYAEALGVDTEKLLLLKADTAEEGLDEVIEWVKTNDRTMIVIDAIGALNTKDEMEKSIGEVTIAGRARLVARLMRKIVPQIDIHDCAFLVLNHEFEAIGGIGVPEVKTSGGKSLEYYRSVWLRLKRTGTNVRVGERTVGYKAEAEVRKNKLAPTERMKAPLEMSYGHGFIAEANLFDEALEAGVIVKKANTYFYGETKLGSISLAKEWLKNNSAEVNAKLT